MDLYLVNKIEEVTPKINRMIADGIATSYIPKSMQYIDEILQDVSKDFPPGLKYLRCERCSFTEEFRKVTERKGSKAKLDIARCDLYLVKFYFEYKGVPLPAKHLYFPFVGQAASLMLNGGRFFVSPVLSDVVISVEQNNVFVRLLRAKMRFHRLSKNIEIDDEEATIPVVWSQIHNKNDAMKKLKSPVTAQTTLPHYLFCKYGFYETFSRFADCAPVVGTTDIDRNRYPQKDWVIFASTRKPPTGRAKGFYEPTNMRIAIRRSELNASNTEMIKALISGFYYVTDLFPDRISVEFVDSPRLWKTIMGVILWSDAISAGILHDNVNKHIDSLDSYMDTIVRVKLRDIGHECQDIYQLMVIIIKNLHTWLRQTDDDINTMYGKELSVLYDVLYDISNSIFHMLFKLRAVTKKELTQDAVERTMAKHFRMKTIFGILKQHKGVNALGYSGDNKFFKITSELVPQTSSGNRGSSKERLSVDDQYLYLHASVAEVGGYLFVPKPDPSGHARISPFVKVDAKGRIDPDPAKEPYITAAQKLISQRAAARSDHTEAFDETVEED